MLFGQLQMVVVILLPVHRVVTVNDTEDPMITCPADVVVDTDSGMCTATGVNLGTTSSK